MRARDIVVMLLLLPGALVRPAAAQTGAWTAEYYNNPQLAGLPVVIRNEAGPRGNWGGGSPHAGVPADGFSTRWTTSMSLEAGSYQISVEGDGGIRVLVNDALVLDAWRETAGELFQVTVPLEAGRHRVVVEFLELEGGARVIFNMDPLLPPPPPDAPRARITAHFLNMRNRPDLHGEIVEMVSLNQVLPVVGRNGLGTWLELAFGERHTWVNARYVEAENLAGVRITDDGPAPVAGVTATVSANVLNLREGPSTGTARLLRLYQGERYPVLGRMPDEEWLWLNAAGINGWAHSDWLHVSLSLETVPVLTADAVLSDATVSADYLNLRAEPSLEGRILLVMKQGEVYPVIGRNADAGWVQLNVRGNVGWASGAWVNVLPELQAVPVIDGSRETRAEAAAADDSGDGATRPASA